MSRYVKCVSSVVSSQDGISREIANYIGINLKANRTYEQCEGKATENVFVSCYKYLPFHMLDSLCQQL